MLNKKSVWHSALYVLEEHFSFRGWGASWTVRLQGEEVSSQSGEVRVSALGSRGITHVGSECKCYVRVTQEGPIEGQYEGTQNTCGGSISFEGCNLRDKHFFPPSRCDAWSLQHPTFASTARAKWSGPTGCSYKFKMSNTMRPKCSALPSRGELADTKSEANLYAKNCEYEAPKTCVRKTCVREQSRQAISLTVTLTCTDAH